MKLIYFANIRIPSEKAHVLQIMQMCEAFARSGAQVTLIAARRKNTPETARVTNPWDFYGVEQCFRLRRLPSLDLSRWWCSGPMTFLIQSVTYTLSAVIHMLFRHADVYYSRDIPTVVALSLFKPRRAIVWEVHQFLRSRIGMFLQRYCARRAGLVIAVTKQLEGRLTSCGAQRVRVAHDGFRPERFEGLPNREEARASSNLPEQLFLVGYVGRQQTMKMSKGVGLLIEAIAAIGEVPIGLCLVGGPDEMGEELTDRWLGQSLPVERFFFTGQVEPARVPIFIAAFDICVLPFPWTEHFAYHASPLKLFEYMASAKPIVSSDLPSIAEVVRDGESALLVPPQNVAALSDAIGCLYEDRALRKRLATKAKQESAKYSWLVRAKNILRLLES